MKYQKIKNVEKPLSKIIFGCAIPVMIQGEDADELLDEVYAQGITTFDTAENYGLSEASLGHWLKNRGNREKVVIISKGCHPYDGRDRVTPEDLKHDIEQSFERLGTDYVEILNEYHKAGRIGAFGGSNWTHQRIAEANAYASKYGLVPFTVSSPNFGLCNQIDDPWGGGPGCVTISGPANEEARAWYRDNHIPVLAYSSLGRGMFAGIVKSNDIEGAKKILDPFAVKGYCYPENFERLARAEQLAAEKNCSVPQIALAWIMNQDFEVFPLVSAKKASRIVSNVQALDITLTKDEAEWLDLRRDRR